MGVCLRQTESLLLEKMLALAETTSSEFIGHWKMFLQVIEKELEENSNESKRNIKPIFQFMFPAVQTASSASHSAFSASEGSAAQ